MDSVPQKVCTGCNVSKPAVAFYVKDKRTGRLYARCKTCDYERTLAYRRAHKERFREIGRRRWAEGKDQQAKRAYLDVHPDLMRRSTAAYRERHRDRLLIDRRQGQQDYYARYRERIIPRVQRYRDTNGEAIRARSRAAYPAKRDLIYAWGHERRARLRGSGGKHTPAEWDAIKAAQGYRCLMCSRSEPDINLTRDHIVPICEGGTNDATNLQGLCKPCNARKGRKTLDLRQQPA